MNKIKVLLVDDHELMRRGIRDAINTSDHFEVIDESDTGEEALMKVEKYQPDVLISDISMSGVSGIGLCKEVRESYPETKVLMLSMHKDPQYIIKAFEAGASGYLPKDVKDEELQKAIIEISEGRKYLNDFVSKILADQFVTNRNTSESIELTSRESEVLEKIVEGFSNKQIAGKLNISDRTVDTHRTNIMKKLNANNTADIVRIAIKRNLV